jgi:thiol-disulfide isomerase/thioredoxin
MVLAPAASGASVLAGVSARFVTVFATMAVVLLCTLSAAVAADDQQMKLGEFIPATPPQPAPEVAFTDTEGKPASLADLKGKPVIVNVWATWCDPCVREMPSLEQLQRNLDGRLVVAAISEDRGGAKVVDPFVEKMGLTKLHVFLDPKSNVSHAFELRGLPTSIILDAQGRVAGRVEGPAVWDSAKMMAVLQPFLNTGATDSPLKNAQSDRLLQSRE